MTHSDVPRSIASAYSLSMSMHQELVTRGTLIESQLKSDGCTSYISSFRKLTGRKHRPAINMTYAQCIQMIKTGYWLNVYEKIALDHQLNIDDEDHAEQLEEKVRAELSKRTHGWYRRRKVFESLFQFSRRAHYAALNFGGHGAQKYGKCCVSLDLRTWKPRATCFSGDSLLACFDQNDNLVLPDDEIKARFGPLADWWHVTLLRYGGYLRELGNKGARFDPRHVRKRLENSDTLIEVHLHGPVTPAQIRSVLVPRDDYRIHWELYKQWEREDRPPVEAYLVARDLVELEHLLAEKLGKRIVT